MLNNFQYFLYNNDLNDYLNCYSTFLMTRKDLKDNILNHRMNFLINYYVNQVNTYSKHKLMESYMRSYKDNYLNTTSNIVKINDDNYIEKRDDDVEDHYKYMFINPPPKPEIDYEELDRQYLLKLESEEIEKNNDAYDDTYDDYDDYDDCNDCNDDYYENIEDDYDEDLDYYY